MEGEEGRKENVKKLMKIKSVYTDVCTDVFRVLHVSSYILVTETSCPIPRDTPDWYQVLSSSGMDPKPSITSNLKRKK